MANIRKSPAGGGTGRCSHTLRKTEVPPRNKEEHFRDQWVIAEISQLHYFAH